MKVADYLRVPYLLQSTAVEHGDGHWSRQVRYPELPGCVAEAQTLLAAIDELDRHRIRVIVELLRAGQRPPVPRSPLRDRQPHEELDRLGLTELAGVVELDEGELAGPPVAEGSR
jgi:predicted RNase H-like HicB family nuclease